MSARPPPPRALLLRLAEAARRSGRAAELELALAGAAAPAPADDELVGALVTAAEAARAPALLRRLVALWPADGRPQGALAELLDLGGDAAAALPLAEAALRLRPSQAHRLLRARLAWRLGDRATAAALWQAALAADPRCLPALRNLAALHASQQEHDEAVRLRTAALALAPDRPELRFELAHTLDRAGDPAAAAAVLDGLPLPGPDAPGRWRWTWLRLHLIEPVLDDTAAVEAAVDGWWARLEALRAASAAVPPAALFACVEPAFPLHYLVDDPLPAQRALAAVVAPAAAAARPWVAPPPRAARGLKVGFASAFFRAHTVGRLFSGWAAGLAQRGVEVQVLHTGPRQDAETAALAGAVHRLAHLPAGAPAQIDALRAMQLDALIFPELGMDHDTLWAAAARCAPLQAMGWGHPISSGLPAVDWFLSSAAMEPPDGAAHYSERLVALPGLSVQVRPAPPPPALPRAALGLPADGPLLLCLQSLFKLLPAFDAAFAELAARLPAASLVFVAHPSPRQTGRFAQRLSAALAAAGADPRQLVIVPQQPLPRFHALIALADVVLDGPGWSGGHTTLECAARGQPVVSRWGGRMRQRHSAAIQAALGLPGLATGAGPAADPLRPWIEAAIGLARAPEARAAARAAVVDAAPAVLDDARGVDALHAVLREATGRG
ncbi:MAG: hypothetical protein RL071_3716 [Pseudomonadota bacterium]|jgi:predicted O-linked N-acetylglucosamine transferase (SPINDLY family)